MFWVLKSAVTFGWMVSFLFRTSTGICSTPCFTIKPIKPLKITEGQTVDIRWEYWSNVPLVLAQWGTYDANGKFEVLIAQQHGSNPVDYTLSVYKSRATIKDKATLRLVNARTSDSGLFGCQLTFQGRNDILKNITELVVQVSGSSTSGGLHNRSFYWIFVAVLFLLVLLVLIYICLQINKRRKLRNLMSHRAGQGKVIVNVEDHQDGYPGDAEGNYQIIPPVGLNPETRKWEIPRGNIVVIKVIGKGAFGLVAKGIAQLRDKTEGIVVALKMLKKNSTQEDKIDFLSELKLMKTLDQHPNVISLYGCVSISEPYLMVVEFVPFGDLLGHLRKSRGLVDTYFDDPDIKPTSSLTSKQLFTYARHTANGMAYLSSKKVIHRDLAARNILVGEGEMCKITDFGLARDVHQENIYTRTNKGRLPVKWTAYESLLYGLCTTMSDVWSYGVVLYEIFTIGGSPYPKIDGKELVNLLQEGHRMPKPKHLKDELYDVMVECWQELPELRPSFADLRDKIKIMSSSHGDYVRLEEYDSTLYENLDDLHV